MNITHSAASVLLLCLWGCASPPPPPATPFTAKDPLVAVSTLINAPSPSNPWDDDLMARLQESLVKEKRDSRYRTASEEQGKNLLLLNEIEHLLPSWFGEQQSGQERSVERVLIIKVVTQFDVILDAFQNGPRERRIVAAWALGFSRVPENRLSIPSPHGRALSALSDGLNTTDDILMNNILLGLWKLGDHRAPVQLLQEIMVRHHDVAVRANAALALQACLDQYQARQAVSDIMTALQDREAKVRLHAAGIAKRFPHPSLTAQIENLLPQEPLPLVRASMATALGSSGSRTSGSVLINLMSNGTAVEKKAAQIALIQIFKTDEGPNPQAWRDRYGS